MKIFFSKKRLILYLVLGSAAGLLVACANSNRDESSEISVTGTSVAEHAGYTDQAYAYLRAHANRFDLEDPAAQLVYLRTATEQGDKHLVFQQVHRSVPVYNSTLTVHFDEHDSIYRVTGKARYVPSDTEVTPVLSEAAAGDRAVAAMDAMSADAKVQDAGGQDTKSQDSGAPDAKVRWTVTSSSLVIYSEGDDASLAYHITLGSGQLGKSVLVDAHDGSVITQPQDSAAQH